MTAPQSNAGTQSLATESGSALTLAAPLLLGLYIAGRAIAGQFTPYSPEMAFANMTVLLLATVLSAAAFSRKPAPRVPEAVMLVVVLWTGAFLWGALRSPFPGAGIPQATDALIYMLLLLCGFFFARAEPRVIPVATRALVAMVVVQAFVGLWQHFIDLPRLHREVAQGGVVLPEALQSGMGLSRLRGTDAFGSFGNPNSLAAYLLLGLGLLAGCCVSSRSRLRWVVVAVAVPLIVLALYFTKSKGAWLAGLLGVWFFAVQRISLRRPSLRSPLRLITLGGIGLLVTLLILATAGLLGPEPFGYSMEVRFDYWRSALKMIADRPLQGVGVGGFAEYYTFHKMPLGEEVKDAHNDFLQLWTELGPLGPLIYLLPWWLVFKTKASPVAHASLPLTGKGVPSAQDSTQGGGNGAQLERLVALGGALGFLLTYAAFAPFNVADFHAVLAGTANSSAVLGALQTLALPLIFVAIFYMLRSPAAQITLLDDGWKHGFLAALGAILIHQLVDFDFRAQAVMGGLYFLGGAYLAGRNAHAAGSGRWLEKISPALPAVFVVGLFLTAVWMPLRSGDARAAAEQLQADARKLAAQMAADAARPLQRDPSESTINDTGNFTVEYQRLREQIVELRRDAVVAAPFDSDAWIDLAASLEALRRANPQLETGPEIAQALNKAEERRPLSPIPRVLLANFYLRNGEARKAERKFGEALARYPLAPGLRLMRGDALFLQRDYLPASAEYLYALRTDCAIADFNVRLTAIFVDKFAGAFPRHGLEDAVLKGITTSVATLLAREEKAEESEAPPPLVGSGETAPELLQLKAGLLVRRLVGLARLLHEENELRASSADMREKLADELLWTGEALTANLPDGPERAHAALLHALSFELTRPPDAKTTADGARFNAAWKRAREMQERSTQTGTPGTPQRLFENLSQRYGPKE